MWNDRFWRKAAVDERLLGPARMFKRSEGA